MSTFTNDEGNAFCRIAETAEHMAQGQTTATALCEMMLQRIGRLDVAVGAYSHLVIDRALQDADASDARRRTGNSIGPIDGIPIAVKDLIDTTPARCRAGLSHLSDYRPKRDADVVQTLRAAGAVVLGVVETDAGAFGTSTPAVLNPVAPDLIAGGSSGGSGAAVAAGFAFAAIGTDTGGSIRIPSNCCSTFGFKPTWGRVSVSGIRPLAPSLDHVGPMARCVADLRLIQYVLDPDVGRNSNASARPLRIGIASRYFDDADQLVKSAMAEVRAKLVHAGCEVQEVALPGPDDVMAVHMVNALKEIADYQTENFGDLWKGYPEIARLTVELGLKVDAADFASAESSRKGLRSAVERIFSGVDLVVVPTLPVDAPARTARKVQLRDNNYSVLEATVRYTAIFNQTGHPVVAMPGYSTAGGRSLGIQLVGALNTDTKLLSAAESVESILAISVDYQSILQNNQEALFRTRASIAEGQSQ